MKQNISESELEVMKVLWKVNQATSSEIIENFNNSDKEEIKNTIVEIDNIVKMINDNIDIVYIVIMFLKMLFYKFLNSKRKLKIKNIMFIL